MPKKQTAPSWGKPGAFAVARVQAGGDIAAAALLYRLKYYFDPKKKIKKLWRFKKPWIAMSRSDWASEAGLSEAEMKNRALPILRKRQFVEIRAMKLKPSGPKLLWMTLDLMKLYEWTGPEDFFMNIIEGTGIGVVKTPAYPYDEAAKKKENW